MIFTLPQDQLQEVINKRRRARSRPSRPARTNGQILGEGVLALVDNQIDPNTGTVRLKATFPNEDYALWPGQFVNVRLLVRTLQQVVTVPSTGRPARAGRHVCLRHQAGFDRRNAAGHRRPDDGRQRRSSRTASTRAPASSCPANTGYSRAACASARGRGRQFRRQVRADHGHLHTIHQTADRDLAAHGGHSVVGRGGLSVSAGRASASGRFSDHPGDDAAAGRRSRTMASSVTAPLERQFAQIPGVTQMTSSSILGVSSVTVQFELGRNIDAAAGDIQAAINAAGGQLPRIFRRRRTIGRSIRADPPDPGLALHSDALPITTVDDYAENVLVAEYQPDSRGRSGQCLRPAKAGCPHPGRSAKLAAMGIGLEDLRGVIATSRRTAQRAASRARHAPSQSMTMINCSAPGHGTTPSSPTRTALRSASATSARRSMRPEQTQARGMGRWQAAVILCRPEAARRECDRDRRPDQSAAAAIAGRHAACRQGRIIIDRTTTIRASVSDVQFTLMLTIALVVMVIFLFLRNFWATVIPEHHCPARAGRHFRARCIVAGVQPRQPVPHGPQHRGRLRGRRCHRHAGEHPAPHGRRTQPVEAAIKGAGEIGFTIMSISLSLVAVFIPFC